MSARQELAEAFRAAFRFQRHEMSEAPNGRAQEVGFVQLPGSLEFKVALWRGGQWVSEKSKPFPETPVCWFSVEVSK